jgi:hypothetical protein
VIWIKSSYIDHLLFDLKQAARSPSEFLFDFKQILFDLKQTAETPPKFLFDFKQAQLGRKKLGMTPGYPR